MEIQACGQQLLIFLQTLGAIATYVAMKGVYTKTKLSQTYNDINFFAVSRPIVCAYYTLFTIHENINKLLTLCICQKSKHY